MRTPTYKKYKIYHNGEFLEEISATSKKNVKEYVKDDYKGKYQTIHENGYIYCPYYRLKNFDIVEVCESEDLPGTTAYKFEIKLSKNMFNTIADPVLEIITRPAKEVTKIGRVIKKMQDRELGQYDFFPSNMFFNTDYWEPHYVYLLSSDPPDLSDYTLNLDGISKAILATTDKEMISEGANELTVTEDFLIFLNGVNEN